MQMKAIFKIKYVNVLFLKRTSHLKSCGSSLGVSTDKLIQVRLLRSTTYSSVWDGKVEVNCVFGTA